jgi:hypothetical protein
VGLANVVAAGVEPQVGVAMLCAVLFAVVQHSLQHIGDGAVVASAIAGCQDHDVPVARRPRIAVPAICVFRYAPVPLWLRLEVARLRLVVVVGHGGDCFARPIVPVVFHWHVAVEPEEDNEYANGRNGEDDCSVRRLVSRCLVEGRGGSVTWRWNTRVVVFLVWSASASARQGGTYFRGSTWRFCMFARLGNERSISKQAQRRCDAMLRKSRETERGWISEKRAIKDDRIEMRAKPPLAAPSAFTLG